MRRRSIAGPLLLILIGALFLLYNLKPELPVSELISVYWPFLLIAWGLIRLVEVVAAHFQGKPQRRGFGGGEVVLIVLICLVGSGVYSAHRRGFRFGIHGLQVFGESFDYKVASQLAAPPDARRVIFENLRGNLRITGSDASEVRVAGRKSIRSLSRAEADRADRETPIEIVADGDALIVRTNQDRLSEHQRASVDMEVTVPRAASVELRGRSGDYDVSDLAGDVIVDCDRADVRLARIGGNVRVDLRRSDLVRVAEVTGNVDLQGRGNDVELAKIAGQVTINGAYAGTLDFKELARPMHFESRNTDLRLEALPGHISMDLSGFTARNVVGPMRLVTKTRDVKIEDFSNALEIETERGDIDLIPNRTPLPKIEARSRFGRIDLTLPPKSAFQLQASTDQGEALNEFGPPIEKETSGRAASLKGRTGPGPVINLTTQRGAVSVRKAGVGSAQAQL